MKHTQCTLFNGITENQLKQMETCLKTREAKFSQDEEICSYNNSFQVLGVILSGKAYVKKLDRNGNYTILETLHKNGIFSDTFAYTATDANAISVFASEPTTVLFIDFKCVFKRCFKACEHHSIFVYNFMKTLLEKSKELSQRIEILSNKTIKDKILSYVSLMVNTLKSKTFILPMSYTTFAEYLCVDRSAMMRELKKLSTSGILKVNKKEITVLSDEYI